MIKKGVLNLIYPRHCPLCHDILENQNALVCEKCKKDIQPIRSAVCMKCGRPVRDEEEYCRDCQKEKRSFDQGKGIFLYDNKWKNSMMHYKYFGCREYGGFYGKAMVVFAQDEIKRWKPEIIVPVPIHFSKRRYRGFNQAEFLAKVISKFTEIPIDSELVRKKKKTKSQKKLNLEERKRNLQNVFEVTKRLKGEKILIVDDVFTTGSTMDTIAKILKENGAKEVYFLTVCIGQI